MQILSPLMLQHSTGVSPAANDAAKAKRHRQLDDAATQFEAIFLQGLLKDSFGGADGQNGSADDDGAGGDTLRSYGLEAVSHALAASGGLGLGRQIVASVEREDGGSSAPAVVQPSR